MNRQEANTRELMLPFWRVIPPLALTAILWQLVAPEMKWLRLVYAFILLFIPWYSYLNWKENPITRIPLFALLALMHWVYFGAPLFWGEVRGGFFAVRRVSDQAIDTVMLMTIVGVISLWVGMNITKRKSEHRILPDLPKDPKRWNYLRVVMVLGVVLSGDTTTQYFAGEELRQVFIILQTMVPATAFAVLYRAWLRNEATNIDRYLAFGYIASQIVFGLASGWTGSVTFVAVLCGIVYFAERRRIPVKAIAILLPCFLFLQVGKGVFRKNYWYRNAEGTVTEKIAFWFEASRAQWDFSMASGATNGGNSLILETLDRVSLLGQAGGVVEKTPGLVPFQNGKTYSYIPIALIPRFFWPDKPSVNEANRFYQVAYGLSAEKDLRHVSIAVGFLMESYINFGWFGVVGIMFLMGWALGWFEHMFFSYDSGVLLSCMGFVITISFLAIESQMAQYVGGVVQRVVLTMLVFLPLTNQRDRKRERETALSAQEPVFR